jgi:S-DNA-T family DNA segregation ATPase FtsK/SpoIIIE
MSVPRRWRLDLAALALLLTGLAVAAAVFSHDPADPPAPTLYPGHREPTNLLGLAGAALAALLHQSLGLGVYPLLAGWFVLVLVAFLRRNVLRWLTRLTGWLVLIPAVALVADWCGVALGSGPAVGYGGSLGAWLSYWLENAVGPVGFWTVLLAALVLGGTLALDFLPLRLVGLLGGDLVRVASACFGLVQRLRWPFVHRSNSPSAPALPSLAEDDAKAEPPEAADDRSDATIPIHRVGAGSGREAVFAELNASSLGDKRYADYELPGLSLLEDSPPAAPQEHDQVLRDRAALLEKTFTDFGLRVRVVGINTGPVITQYEVSLETGLRLHKVTALADDLALNLKVPSVRIVAPIPGKNTVGIEVPNEHRAKVRLKEVILNATAKCKGSKLPLFIGKDTEGKPLVYDLAEMPHLLIAGRTGTGKSVCMNALILSLLMTRRPDEVKMILIDPKMLELIEYSKIPHLMHPVVKDMKKAEAILAWAVDKMEERYDILSRARVRSIAAYNELPPEEILKRVQPVDEEERKRVPDRMPYIVIFIDEMADLMMMLKKEVEGHIIRLAQKSRAAGIHLVVATQKPTVDVITGLIKSNLPARICFQVSSRTDSRVVLDEMGADKLLGKGDMLFLQPGTSTLVRAQGSFASDEEIERVVECLECDPDFAQELVRLSTAGKEGGSFLESLRARDELYEQAIDVIVSEGRGSTSLLQRALGIGYGRAARLIDYMAEDGIVGEYNGSQARDVLYKPEQWEQVKQSGRLAASA